nr:hypothetical protein Q903MT_gene1818 [Picea sitchensis]
MYAAVKACTSERLIKHPGHPSYCPNAGIGGRTEGLTEPASTNPLMPPAGVTRNIGLVNEVLLHEVLSHQGQGKWE